MGQWRRAISPLVGEMAGRPEGGAKDRPLCHDLGRSTEPGRNYDMLADIVDVADDVVIPEAQHGPAVLLQTRCPCFIASDGLRMLGAIDLDDDFPDRASEVDNVPGNRKLAPKAKPHQPMRAKLVPELQFGWCHDLAHRSGVCAMLWRQWRVGHCRCSVVGEVGALRRPPLSCRTSPPRGGRLAARSLTPQTPPAYAYYRKTACWPNGRSGRGKRGGCGRSCGRCR